MDENFLLKIKPGDVFILMDNDWDVFEVDYLEIHKVLAVGEDSEIFVDRIAYPLSNEGFKSKRKKLMLNTNFFPNNSNIFLIENDYWTLAVKGHSENNKKIFNQINEDLRVLIEYMEENL